WPSTLRRDVSQIYESSRHLLELINDVLDLARVDRVEMPLHAEPADLCATVREATTTSADLLRGREIELRTVLPPALPRLTFDRTRIRQVLLNLLNNAARFTEKGSITVEITCDERDVIVSVSDTGVGIPAEELPRVFDEFHQGDMSLRRRHEGAGLGLAISKRFVELHGGRIWAESTAGQGSRFCFTLPISAQAAVGQLVTSRAPEPQPASDQATVVLVDPDAAVGGLLQRYLNGYRVEQVSALGEARAQVEQWHPRALLINTPPGSDLGEILEQSLAHVPRRVPVITCSLPSQSWLSGRMGIVSCLSKPVTRDDLLQAVRSVPGAQRILVVDDSRSFTQLVARFLSSAPEQYTVWRAYNEEEALAQIHRSRPDLILLDLVMPGMGGLRLLDKIRQQDSLEGLPVLIVTAASYADAMLSLHGSVTAVARLQAFSTAEIIRYLQQTLDATEAEYESDTVPAP
ncbi:MAG: ATP-binding protein, partial [Anaerolineae bacterium]